MKQIHGYTIDDKPVVVLVVEAGDPARRFLGTRTRINQASYREVGRGFPDGAERSLLDGKPLTDDEDIYLITSCQHAFPAGAVPRSVVVKFGVPALLVELRRLWGEAQRYKHWFV